jgi:trimethylamine--corrinoid protein Co-methyltransferase
MAIVRPKIKILDDDYKQKILGEAKMILETQGIFVENHEAIDMFNKYGLNHKGLRYFIPPDLVDKCLGIVPSEITLYDRERNKHTTLKGENINYDPGSAAIFILDEETGNIREGLSKDFIRFSKVVEQLKFIDAQSTALIYNDVPNIP